MRRISWMAIIIAACVASRLSAEPPDEKCGSLARDAYGDPLPPNAILRLGTTRFHHHAFIQATAFSPDGRLLASAAGNQDTAIALRDMPSGRLLRLLTAHSKKAHRPWTSALAFSPDGKKLVTSDVGGTIHLWNVIDGAEICSIDAHPGSIGSAVAFSADGLWFASGGTDGVVRVWSTDGGFELLSFDTLPKPVALPGGPFAGALPGSIAALAFSPDGSLLAAGMAQRPFQSKTGKIRIWNLRTNEPVASLDETRGELESLVFSPDGKQLISGGNATISRDKFGKPYRALTVRVVRLRVWNIQSGNIERELSPLDPEVGYGALALAADGRTLAVGCNGKVLVLDFPAAKIRRSIDVPKWPGDHGLAISADGQMVCAPIDNTIGLWSTATGESLLPKAESHTSFVTAVAYTNEGDTIVTGGDGTVRGWNADTGHQTWSRPLGDEPSITAAAVSSDGALIAAGGWITQGETGVRLLRTATGEERQFIAMFEKRFHALVVRTLAFSPDGSLLAIVYDRPMVSNTYDMALFDVETGKRRTTIASGFFLGVRAMAFSSDAEALYTMDREAEVSVWDTATGERRRLFTALKPPPEAPGGKPQKPWIADAIFSPDMKTLITSQNRDLVVWDAGRGEPIATIAAEGTDKGGNMALSKDGRLLAITDLLYVGDFGSDAIRIFDLTSQRRIATFESEQGRPSALAFSPDGSRLVTGMSDGTALVWHLDAP